MEKIQVQSLGWEDSLEKGMAAHSSIFAWRIPWTEEPGGLHGAAKSQTWLSDWYTLLVILKMFQNFHYYFCYDDLWSVIFPVNCSVAQSCLTLFDPMDCNPPGSSVHRILQARLLKRVAVPFSSLSYYYCNCFGHHQRWWIWLISVCIWLLRGMTASPPPSLSSGLLIPWDTTILKLGPIHNPKCSVKGRVTCSSL